VRRLNKSNKAIQSKILAFPSACKFLQLVGFDFTKNLDVVELTDYRKDILSASIEALELHIKNHGGQVQSTTAKFDPYKSSISTTDFNSMKVPVSKEGPIDTYDPSAVQTEIQKI